MALWLGAAWLGGCAVQATTPAHTGTESLLPAGFVALSTDQTVVGWETGSAGEDLAFLASGELLIGAPSVPGDDETHPDHAFLLPRAGSGILLQEIEAMGIDDWWDHGSDPYPYPDDYGFHDQNGFGGGVVAPGDVTGDGWEDLAVADTPDPDRGIGEWAVQPGRAEGWPTSDTVYWTGMGDLTIRILGWATSARATRCGDLDADGVAELCTSDGIVFGPIAEGAAPGLTWSAEDPQVVGADLDQDGAGELVVSDATSGSLHHLSVFPRAGASTLAGLADATWTVAGGRVTALAVGDLDGDGAPDLVVGWSDPSGAGVSVGLPVGGGDLVADASTTLAVTAEDLAIGDFDGDGQVDLAIGGDAKVTVWLGPLPAGPLSDADADARYVGNEYPLDRFGHALAAADTDADGRAELAIGAPGEALSGFMIEVRQEFGRVWWLAAAGL